MSQNPHSASDMDVDNVMEDDRPPSPTPDQVADRRPHGQSGDARRRGSLDMKDDVSAPTGDVDVVPWRSSSQTDSTYRPRPDHHRGVSVADEFKMRQMLEEETLRTQQSFDPFGARDSETSHSAFSGRGFSARDRAGSFAPSAFGREDTSISGIGTISDLGQSSFGTQNMLYESNSRIDSMRQGSAFDFGGSSSSINASMPNSPGPGSAAASLPSSRPTSRPSSRPGSSRPSLHDTGISGFMTDNPFGSDENMAPSFFPGGMDDSLPNLRFSSAASSLRPQDSERTGTMPHLWQQDSEQSLGMPSYSVDSMATPQFHATDSAVSYGMSPSVSHIGPERMMTGPSTEHTDFSLDTDQTSLPRDSSMPFRNADSLKVQGRKSRNERGLASLQVAPSGQEDYFSQRHRRQISGSVPPPADHDDGMRRGHSRNTSTGSIVEREDSVYRQDTFGHYRQTSRGSDFDGREASVYIYDEDADDGDSYANAFGGRDRAETTVVVPDSPSVSRVGWMATPRSGPTESSDEPRPTVVNRVSFLDGMNFAQASDDDLDKSDHEIELSREETQRLETFEEHQERVNREIRAEFTDGEWDDIQMILNGIPWDSDANYLRFVGQLGAQDGAEAFRRYSQLQFYHGFPRRAENFVDNHPSRKHLTHVCQYLKEVYLKRNQEQIDRLACQPSNTDIADWLSSLLITVYNQFILDVARLRVICNCTSLEMVNHQIACFNEPTSAIVGPSPFPETPMNITISANDFMDRTCEWIERAILNNEHALTTRVDQGYCLDYLDTLIPFAFKQIFRVYAHFLHQHGNRLKYLKQKENVFQSFRVICRAGSEFNLISFDDIVDVRLAVEHALHSKPYPRENNGEGPDELECAQVLIEPVNSDHDAAIFWQTPQLVWDDAHDGHFDMTRAQFSEFLDSYVQWIALDDDDSELRYYSHYFTKFESQTGIFFKHYVKYKDDPEITRKFYGLIRSIFSTTKDDIERRALVKKLVDNDNRDILLEMIGKASRETNLQLMNATLETINSCIIKPDYAKYFFKNDKYYMQIMRLLASLRQVFPVLFDSKDERNQFYRKFLVLSDPKRWMSKDMLHTTAMEQIRDDLRSTHGHLAESVVSKAGELVNASLKAFGDSPMIIDVKARDVAESNDLVGSARVKTMAMQDLRQAIQETNRRIERLKIQLETERQIQDQVVSDINEQRVQMQQRKEEMLRRKSELERTNLQLANDIIETQTTLEAHKDTLGQKRKSYEAMKREISEQMQRAKREYLVTMADLKSKVGRLNQLEQHIKALSERKQVLMEQINRKAQDVRYLGDLLRNKEEEVSKLRNELDSLQREYASVKTRLSKQIKSATAERDDLRVKLEKMRVYIGSFRQQCMEGEAKLRELDRNIERMNMRRRENPTAHDVAPRIINRQRDDLGSAQFDLRHRLIEERKPLKDKLEAEADAQLSMRLSQRNVDVVDKISDGASLENDNVENGQLERIMMKYGSLLNKYEC